MKKLLWIALLLLALTATLAACGGGSGEAPAQPAAGNEAPAGNDSGTVATAVPAEGNAPAAEEENAPAAAEDTPPAQEASVGSPAESGDMVAGRPASGTDPDTGLEINPDSVVPGVDFIVRGALVNSNLTPQDKPEFLVQAPSGTRYRIHPQPVPQISYEDGTQPAPHEYRRGMLVQATVRQEEDAGATIVVTSTDLTLLRDE